jgi:deoxycytidine triphosphate deaminase
MKMFPDYTPHPWKSRDPDWGEPGRKGMFLSDQIRRFCDKKLLISEGYSESNLRPAAYTLTIGPKYRDHEGNPGELTEQNPTFEMRPNSIVFVTIAESLDLPYYVAARFNLRVDWVYKGVLLGTGPQVEPGFRGTLSCPLYNLTSRAQTIRLGQEFATIDFERTTDFVKEDPLTVHENLERRGKGFGLQVWPDRILAVRSKTASATWQIPRLQNREFACSDGTRVGIVEKNWDCCGGVVHCSDPCYSESTE